MINGRGGETALSLKRTKNIGNTQAGFFTDHIERR